MKKYDSQFIKEINESTFYRSKVFIFIVFILEIVMIIYGVSTFDFSRVFSKIYLSQYIYKKLLQNYLTNQ